MMQVKKSNYGEYSTGNYGAHTMRIDLGRLVIWFSYDTVIAFRYGILFRISINEWGTTTGKHLNYIDSDKSIRIPHDDMMTELEKVLNEMQVSIR